jgi:hypothetical protein
MKDKVFQKGSGVRPVPNYGSSGDASLLASYGLELCTYNDERTTMRERMGISRLWPMPSSNCLLDVEQNV